MAKDRECAFIVCVDRDGKLHRGASACGTKTNVAVDIKCSCSDQIPIAIIHDHPSNIPIPSKKDMDTSRAHGNIIICVRTETHGVKCYLPTARPKS
jgi:hypothetical protein